MGEDRLRIGDLAKRLKVKEFVIRFWEKEFELAPKRTSGGQRYYDKEDLKTFRKIKRLLYTRKYTIPGAKQHLHESHPTHKQKTKTRIVRATTKPGSFFPSVRSEYLEINYKLFEQLLDLKRKLLAFKEVL